MTDVDTDGDGAADCDDGCPSDGTATAPGLCGCGIPDTDADCDGVPDCQDACPDDPAKIYTGQCGCGVADTDSDADGIADCNDTPPVVEERVCGTVPEWQTLSLACPADTAITSVAFASYGTPEGTCGDFSTSSCHSASSLAVVESLCVGTSSCSIPATNSVFGDPCFGTFKRLSVEAVCTPLGSAPSVVCAAVPEWSTATLTCPAGRTIQSIDFASYGTPEGTCGAFGLGWCDAASSRAVVEAACLGASTCSIPATNGVFGDPCFGTFKRLFIGATCSP